MINDAINLEIHFESLIKTVRKLNLDDKYKLSALLEKQIAEVEEKIWEQDSNVKNEIKEARQAYRNGDCITVDDYIAHGHK